jgi:DNA modification methylase
VLDNQTPTDPGGNSGTRELEAVAVFAQPPGEPDLSHIAPGLRHLAVPVGQLSLMVGNPRSHPTKNLEAIKAALVEYGQVETILVNRRRQPWEVIHGNGRLQEALELGWTHVAAHIIDVDDATAKAMAVVLNRTGELAEWDKEELDKLLHDVQTSEKLHAMLAELATEQGIALAPTPGMTDPDDVPAPPDQPITQPGDLWILGEHRLLCGDAGITVDVDRLLDGASIHLVNCDPPYGVRDEPRSNNAISAGLSSFELTHHQQLDLARHPQKAKPTAKKLRPRDRPLANDFVSEDAFRKLLDAWIGNLARVLLPGHSWYLWGGFSNCGTYPPLLQKHGLYFSQAIIWDKQHPVLTRKDFMGAHEWCFYGWKLGAAHRFFGPANATDLWSVKKINPQRMIHLTEKPVELAVRALQYSSRPGENVVDLFAGSGSSLIAAEQTGRRAFLMEIDPLYVDVIVERYERFSGHKAERQSPR